jgi:phosphatidylserine/phosphatidylglycerophosphate/cardiolipin synthase-like enzyme
MMNVKFARGESVAEGITSLLRTTTRSIDAALYRLNHPRLARALEEAVERGVWVRLVVDGNKYNESRATQELLARAIIPFRLAYGRQGPGSKMHHKFVILDQQTVLTGSYNWTLESEDENYENLVMLDEPQPAEAFAREFEALWVGAERGNAQK